MRVQKGTMLYDPYTTLVRRYDGAGYHGNDKESIPPYMSSQAASYWSDTGSPLQSGKLPSAGNGPSVIVRFLNGNDFELRQLQGQDVNVREAACALLTEVGLPRLRRDDIIYMVHSNEVRAMQIRAAPGTRVHIIKKKVHGVALKDIELVNGIIEIDALPSQHEKFLLIVMRACGYFSCNMSDREQRQFIHKGWVFHQGVFSESTRTLSNLPGSHVLPNSPHVHVAW